MNSRIYVAKRFLVAFAGSLLYVVGIPSAIVGVMYILGVNVNPKLLDTLAEYIQPPTGPVLIIVLAIGVAIYITHRIISQDRQDYATQFYEFNSQACVERAHLIFCRLYWRGKVLENGVAEDRNDWDRQLQMAFKRNCDPAALNTYLVNTKRFEFGNESYPVATEDYKFAVEFVDGLLKNDFAPYGLKC